MAEPFVTMEADFAVRLGSLDLQVDLRAEPGEVVALLGPNGAGKTTVVRCLAGLEQIDRGRISLDGQLLADAEHGLHVPSGQRHLGVVFQDYLLFPHLSILENVAFGLRSRGVDRRAARDLARHWLERVGISELAAARPGAISGGQAQRAALARALAAEPRLLLLDEPLAALDATTRTAVRRELKHHLADLDATTVLVTHDPLDALALADHVVVLEAGRVTQDGTLTDVTTRPRTAYVAELIGVNLLHGTAINGVVGRADSTAEVVTADAADGPTIVVIRPSSISLHRGRPDTSARNQWRCRVVGFDQLGERIRVRLSGPFDLVAEVTAPAVAELDLVSGASVWASVKATDVLAYPD